VLPCDGEIKFIKFDNRSQYTGTPKQVEISTAAVAEASRNLEVVI